jgi:hypothetical protein
MSQKYLRVVSLLESPFSFLLSHATSPKVTKTTHAAPTATPTIVHRVQKARARRPLRLIAMRI